MSESNVTKLMSHDADPDQTGSLLITFEAMNPVELKRGGQGLVIQYGFGQTPLGEVLVGWTSRGVCHFAFLSFHHDQMVAELKAYWPHAIYIQDDQAAMQMLNTIFTLMRLSEPQGEQGKIHLLLKGTHFQINVWKALIDIDLGQVVSYKQLALQAGYPRAARAVGSALAANRIGFLIPCHRVIRENGETGHYRWGDARKKALLTWEAMQRLYDTSG
jgi:AraC family transcriptional regulator of adaptative response/methylated-DNA-[protein]-cysteine methyltransferase